MRISTSVAWVPSARRYLTDFYGSTSSPLHAGLPTDRLVAEWHLESERVIEPVWMGREPGHGSNFESVRILSEGASSRADCDDPGGGERTVPGIVPGGVRGDLVSARACGRILHSGEVMKSERHRSTLGASPVDPTASLRKGASTTHPVCARQYLSVLRLRTAESAVIADGLPVRRRSGIAHR